MKAVFAFLLATMLVVAVFAEEDKKEDEKKPLEKVVWPGWYGGWGWQHPAPVKVPVHLVHQPFGWQGGAHQWQWW